MRKINFSLAINNVFTYPYIVNYYGTDVGKIVPRIGSSRQLDWRLNFILKEQYAAFIGASFFLYRTKFTYHYFKFYYPRTTPTLIAYPPTINTHMLFDLPFGISKSWNINANFQINTNIGIKQSIIQSTRDELYFEKSYILAKDSSYICLYQDMYSADQLTIFYKYFGEVDVYYNLKNMNLIGIGLNFTGAINRKSKPQISALNYFYYYNQLRGEGYLRNSGAYLGIKLSYKYGHKKKNKNKK